jgi:arabinose-5-phosphate isomerase
MSSWSHSGETDEVVRLLMAIRRIGAKLIALTASASSTLGRAADITLDCSVAKEACPQSRPTASTTVALAMGDALAMTRKRRASGNFVLHPGGNRPLQATG